MNAMREAWTDERLDDLRDRMGQGFVQVDRRFEQVDKRFDRVEGDLRDLRAEMNARFDRLQVGLIAFAGTISAALIAAPHL